MKFTYSIALCITLFSPFLSAMDKDYPQLSPLFPKEFSEKDISETNALFIKPSPEYSQAVKTILKEKYALTPAQQTSYQAVCWRKVTIARENQRLEKIKEKQKKEAEANQRKIAEEKKHAEYLIETQKLAQQQEDLLKKIAIAKKTNAQLKQRTAKPTQKKELTPAELQLYGQRQLQKHFGVTKKASLLEALTHLCDKIWDGDLPNNKAIGHYFNSKIHRLFGPVNTRWSYDFSPCTNNLLIKSEPYTIPTCNEPCVIRNCNFYSDKTPINSSDSSYEDVISDDFLLNYLTTDVSSGVHQNPAKRATSLLR